MTAQEYYAELDIREDDYITADGWFQFAEDYAEQENKKLRDILKADRQTLIEKDAEIKELKEYIKNLKCPNSDCDNKGTIAYRIAVDDWDAEPCQWCYEREQILKQ